jgi:hypothetical protein
MVANLAALGLVFAAINLNKKNTIDRNENRPKDRNLRKSVFDS